MKLKKRFVELGQSMRASMMVRTSILEQDFVLKIFFFMTFFFFCSHATLAVEPEVIIDEKSSLTKVNSGGYSLVADGTLEIYNPSNISKIVEYSIPISLDALIGINKITIDNTSSHFDFSFSEIKGYMIAPNSSVKVGYHIFGLVNDNVYNQKKESESVLEYYADSFDFYSNIIVNLQKPQQGAFNNSFNNSRNIWSGIRNPTDFDYIAKEINLYKSNVSDPFFNDGVLLKTYKNISVAPFQLETVEYFDQESGNQSVYWVSTDVVTSNIFTVTSSEQYVGIQAGGNGYPEESSGGRGGGGGSISIENVIDSILVKKESDKTIVMYDDEVRITLSVVNINDVKVSNLSLIDEIPESYELKNISSSVTLNEGVLTFNIDEIEKYGTFTISYSLVNKKEARGITYLKPAKLLFLDKTFFSEGILLVNQLLPEEKIFVQKEVKLVDGDFARVTIRIKNLGTVPVEDLLVSDNIDENAILKEISKVFHERGVWKIRKLGSGEEWEVSYLIERTSSLDSLPNVFGVDKASVFGTLISSEEVVTIFNEGPGTIEKVGLGLAVAILVFYLLF